MGIEPDVSGLGTTVVTFETAFPNGFVTGNATLDEASSSEGAQITAHSASSMTLRNGTGAASDILWTAWGY